MRLREWLDSEGKSPEWLAGKLAVDGRTVRRWLVGDAHPRDPDHMKEIEALSKGKVSASDVLFRPVAKRKAGRPPRQRAA